MDKLTQKEKVAYTKKQTPQPEDDKPFRLGEQVKVFDKNGISFKGTVRSIKKDVLGIEVVSYTHIYI